MKFLHQPGEPAGIESVMALSEKYPIETNVLQWVFLVFKMREIVGSPDHVF